MKKVVIKTDRKNSEKKKSIVAEAVPELEIEIQQNIADVVNNWISERRENRLLERAFTDEQISSWKIDSSLSNLG